MLKKKSFETIGLSTSSFRKDYILLLLFIIRTTMSNIYIEKNSYNKIIRLGKDPKNFVNDAVKEKLEREEQ